VTEPPVPVFDPPIDATPTWLGIAAVSIAVLGVVLSLPTAPPPDAAGAAAAVDRVAASEGDASTVHPLRSRSVRLAREGIVLEGPGRARAAYAFGPVTPVREGTGLYRVLAGVTPADAFGSPAAFARAVEAARDRAPVRAETDRLRVRHVRWEGVDATLVGP